MNHTHLGFALPSALHFKQLIEKCCERACLLSIDVSSIDMHMQDTTSTLMHFACVLPHVHCTTGNVILFAEDLH